ncbi:prickle-like protein 4 isoform X1 [Pantherophis guttatus]|uniref:Prickle-like protein 4 isoform X1 n=1 Tax=Pantherophis guttatus TaxID=94885 RepID=A0ABM3ZBQ3_PANGU|nr:prickle-like protein 4 isoform X1 [Pantherophis guttatus]XP_060545801.1 prickle-like protein 4 isoform X1 [Pantherophis guttatus]
MSQPSHIWSQRERSPCSRIVTSLPPASSSDSDSGCALEDYPGPTTEFPPSDPVRCFQVLQSSSSFSSAVVPAAIHNQLRIKILLYQLPPQDCDERYCPFIGEEERKQLRTFAAWRRQESLGQGVLRHLPFTAQEYLCRNCDMNIIRGDQGVFASKLGEQCWWHPTCFVCHICQQPLIDLIYFHRDEKIFCGRHHAEFFRPRCASCDQLIFTSECVEAEGMRWHEEHFCCLECDLPLSIQQYVMKGGQPCCCACFESLYADICQACGEIVGVNSKQIVLQGQHWHSKDSCFCCSLCRKALLGQPITIHNGLLFCSEACSLEKESALSSSGSDSSDSAFISAPSPDSTPISRARNSSPDGSSETTRPQRNGREERAGAVVTERLHSCGNSSVYAEFNSQEESVSFRNRIITPQLHIFESLTVSPQEDVQISISHPMDTAWSTTVVRDNRNLETYFQETSQPQADFHFKSRHSVASQASVLIMDFPDRIHEGSTGEQEATVEQDDSKYLTCSSSSSSDSEPEGFFFGKPIPKPGSRCGTFANMEQETLGKGMGWAARARVNSKHCSIS